MVKKQYIIPSIIKICLLLLTISNAYASPWLPEEGRFQYIIDFHTANTSSNKESIKNSKHYYLLEREIHELENLRTEYNNSKGLTNEAKNNRNIEINQKIHNIRRIQSFTEGYYPTKLLGQSIEYGVSNNVSLFCKIFNQTKRNFVGSQKKYSGFEIGPKFRIKKWGRNILSIQPTFGIHYKPGIKDQKFGQIKFLFGKYKYTTLGKTFDAIEIAPTLSKSSWECAIDYTTGLERENGLILMIQSSNKLRPKANKLYQKTSSLQFGVAKGILLSNDIKQNKITLQIGYLREFSVSARRSLMSGVKIAAWINI